MDYPKSVPSVGLVNGKFVDENTVSGAPGSLISASWGNAVTDELLAVIQAAQIEPSEGDLDQLLEAIRYIVQDDAYTKNRVYNKEEIDALLKNNNLVPIGMMVPFPKASVPPGYLEVDGSLQSIAAYPDLAAYLGTSYNKAGDPAGYFRLPESRGEFLRGWDHGRGVDAGRGLGSSQADSLQGFRQESIRYVSGGVGNDDGGVGASATGFAMGTAVQGTRPRNLTGAFFSDGVNGEPRVGSETRGRNIAVMWCIRAWNAPINQGSIDIAELAEQVQKLSINGPVVGSIRKGSMSILTPAATATYSADELVLVTVLGSQSYRLANFNRSVNLATVGVGGMDTGTAPVSGYVAIYAIYNPVTKISGLLATNAVAKVSEVYNGGNMPAGFSASCLLTVLVTDSNRNFNVCTVRDRTVHISSAYVYSTQSIVSGALVAPSTVPPNAVSISGTLDCTCTTSAQLGILVLDGETGTGLRSLIGSVTANGTIVCPFSEVNLDTSKRFTVNTSIVGSGTATFRVATSEYKV